MTNYQNTASFVGRVTAILAVIALGGGAARADTFNIEIDYMVKYGTGAHSHQPTTAEVNAVIQMFACQGHTANIVVDDELPHYTAIPRNPSDCGSLFGYSGEPGSWGQLKADYFDHAGDGGWHYCIFAHQYEVKDDDGNCVPSGSSGIAEVNGDDLIVSLGAFDSQVGTPWDRASTLAHEFGHNLGLGHCGTMNCNNVGPRPLNVASIMSYFYQLTGVRANLECQGLAPEGLSLFKHMDYSDGTMCTLNEASLWEYFGTGMVSVDWNCSGSISGTVAHDLNENSGGWCGANGGLQTLSDYNEWGNIHDSTRDRGAPLDNLPEVSCVTAEEMAVYRSSRHWCAQPAAVSEACVGGDMLYVSTGGSSSGNGRCSSAYDSVQDAHDAAPWGSVIFLAPGKYTESTPSVPLVLDRKVTLAGPGSITVE